MNIVAHESIAEGLVVAALAMLEKFVDGALPRIDINTFKLGYFALSSFS